MSDLIIARRSPAVALAVGLFLAAAPAARAQSFVSDPLVQANFTGISQIGSSVGGVTQMVFGPDGRLYVSTFNSGVRRYDYNPNGSLTNPVTVWSRVPSGGQQNGSLGVAFHQDATLGTVMYIAPAVSGDFDPTLNLTQSILRLTDNDGDGAWGETGAGEVNQAVVNNLRVTDLHQVNQIVIDDDTLYVGIGSRTRTGGERSEYGGAPSPDDGEFSYTGAVNWIRDLTQLSGNTTTANIAGHTGIQHHTSTLPFSSAGTGKLTVYSTGFRNVYGIALDAEGQLWATMNQNEDPLKPDELHRTDFQDDHQFPKRNEVSGDWKQNASAISAGFFNPANSEEPVALLGNNASADGLDFTYANDALAGQPFLVRFGYGDLATVDPDTGAVRRIATGFPLPLDVLTDPQGNLLVGTLSSGGRIYRVGVVDGVGQAPGDLNQSGALDAADWAIQRDNFNANLSGLTAVQSYVLGDLNSDFINDGLDFGLFKTAFDQANGSGAFAAMLAVPEPSAPSLLLLAAGGFAPFRRRFK